MIGFNFNWFKMFVKKKKVVEGIDPGKEDKNE